MEAVLLKCQTCDGSILMSEDGKHGKCEFCGNEYYFREPKSSAVIMALNEANAYRLRNDFDSAIIKYRSVLTQVSDDADAYWGLALSEYGIEFVEDTDGRFVPTCRRTVQESILDNDAYLKALNFAAPEQARIFRRTAEQIDVLQRRIKKQLEQEEDYDVFLSFKSTDGNGRPTADRYIARKIYEELQKYGIRTFYSEEALRNRVGEDYEPIIYRALYSSKVFILIATKPEYINAAWVKYEWSRYRDRLRETSGLQAFAVFKDLRPSALPTAFRGQGVDLSKYPAGGYEVEIADNLAVKFGKKEKSLGVDVNEIKDQLRREFKNTAPNRGASALDGQLFQSSVALNGGKFDDAAAMYSAVLDREEQCAEAYWGRMLASAGCKNDAALINSGFAVYKRALKGDDFRTALKYARGDEANRIAKVMKEMLGHCEKKGDALRAEIERLKKHIDELSKKSTRLKTEAQEQERKKLPLPPKPDFMNGVVRAILALLCLGVVIGIVALVFYFDRSLWQRLRDNKYFMFIIWGAMAAAAILFGVIFWLIGVADDRRWSRKYHVYYDAEKHNQDIDNAIAELDKQNDEAQAAIKTDREKASFDNTELAEWDKYKEYLGTLIDWQKQNVKVK